MISAFSIETEMFSTEFLRKQSSGFAISRTVMGAELRNEILQYVMFFFFRKNPMAVSVFNVILVLVLSLVTLGKTKPPT